MNGVFGRADDQASKQQPPKRGKRSDIRLKLNCTDVLHTCHACITTFIYRKNTLKCNSLNTFVMKNCVSDIGGGGIYEIF